MEAPEFVSLGTICIVKGNTKKLMVIARGVALKLSEGLRYFDYGACAYPEGLMGDQVIYFNHDTIQKVVFEGFTDEDNELMLENLSQSIKVLDMEKGSPKPVQIPKA